MFSSSISSCGRNASINDVILAAAVRYAVRKGRVTTVQKHPERAMERGITAKSMGFSTWDRHKLSIITDIVIAFLIVSACLGVRYGCHPSTRIWAITGGSLGLAALSMDFVGYRLNIRRLSNRIKEEVSSGAKERRKTTDKQL